MSALSSNNIRRSRTTDEDAEVETMISQNTTDLLGMQPDHTEDSEADIFDQAFTAAVLSIALDFVEAILLQRIKQEGVRISNRQTKNLRSQLEQIARGERTAVSIAIRRWKWWNNDDIAIELSEDDLQNLDEMTGKLIAESPKILEDSVEPISEVIFQTLQKSWPKYSRTQDKDLSGFHKRLNDAWGEVPPVAVPLPMLDSEPSVVPGVGAS